MDFKIGAILPRFEIQDGMSEFPHELTTTLFKVSYAVAHC
jgi:hypothetical protein